MKPLAISLFSGALGFDIGVERAGFNIALAVEFEKNACATIRHNRPSLPLCARDITTITGSDILTLSNARKGEVDLLFGGPPCQSFSTAGKRASIQDARGTLFFHFLRLVSEIQPRFFIIENVRGVLSAAKNHRPIAEREHAPLSDNERFGSVLEEVYKEIQRIGYAAHHSLLSAADYGVPQTRERVFFIGSKNGLFVPFPLPTHKNAHLTLRDALMSLEQDPIEYTPFSPARLRFMKEIPPGGCWRDLPEHLQKEAMGGAFNSTGGRVGFFRRLSWDKPSPTLVTSPTQKSTMLCHPDEDRPLSVAEYARIQQFPDDWEFSGSITAKYKQIGNAVPIGLGFAVARTLLD